MLGIIISRGFILWRRLLSLRNYWSYNIENEGTFGIRNGWINPPLTSTHKHVIQDATDINKLTTGSNNRRTRTASVKFDGNWKQHWESANVPGLSITGINLEWAGSERLTLQENIMTGSRVRDWFVSLSISVHRGINNLYFFNSSTIPFSVRVLRVCSTPRILQSTSLSTISSGRVSRLKIFPIMSNTFQQTCSMSNSGNSYDVVSSFG